jgi:hypothetical protein
MKLFWECKLERSVNIIDYIQVGLTALVAPLNLAWRTPSLRLRIRIISVLRYDDLVLLSFVLSLVKEHASDAANTAADCLSQ